MKRIFLLTIAFLLIAGNATPLTTGIKAVVSGTYVAAGGGASYTDAFTGDANPIGSPWVTGPGILGVRKVGGVARAASDGTDNAFAYYNETFNANQYSQAKMLTWGGGAYNSPGVSVRNDGTDTYYAFVRFDASRIYVYRWNSGTPTAVGNCSIYYSYTTHTGDTLRIEANGTTITVKVDADTIATCTGESTLSTGSPGLFFFGGVDATSDDWAGGDL